jgi:hypothetical protein
LEENNEEAETPTEEKTINEFLKSHYKNVEGIPIFKYCYEPVNGVRQVVVDEENELEARLICKDFKKELVNYMAEEVAEQAVIDYIRIKKDMEVEHYEAWRPNTVALDYQIAELGKSPQKRGIKRTKYTNTENRKGNQSYAIAAKNAMERNPENHKEELDHNKHKHTSFNSLFPEENASKKFEEDQRASVEGRRKLTRNKRETTKF